MKPALPPPATKGFNSERARRDAAGEQRFVALDDCRLSYWDRGAGRPVVLLHGLGGSAFDWRHQIDPLTAAGHRVVAFEFLGSGLSDTPTRADYSMLAQARLIAAAMRRLELGPAVLVGNSFGGGVALLLAQLHPELVEGLVLISSVCYRQHLPEFVRLFRMPVLPGLLARLVPTRPITQAVLWETFGNAHAVSEDLIRDYVMEINLPQRKLGLVYTARDIVPRDPGHFEAGIRKIQTPTRILWGALDTVIPIKYGFRLQRDLPGAQMTVFEPLGHIPHQEAPELVNRHLLDFLAPRARRANTQTRRRNALQSTPR